MPEYTNEELTIMDLDKVEEPAENDYLLIDSETEGVRCISVANFKGGE